MCCGPGYGTGRAGSFTWVGSSGRFTSAVLQDGKTSSKMGGRGWRCVSAATCAARTAPLINGVRGPERDPREVPHIESLCAPKRREKFLGISLVEELEVFTVGASRKDSSQVAS